MRFLSLLLLSSAALLWSVPVARATEGPPPAVVALNAPAAPAAPAPAPEAPAAAAPKAARREDEEQTPAAAPQGWSLNRLTAYLKTKSSLGAAVDERDKTIAALNARIAALESGAELKAARDEAAALRADLEGFANYAQTHGLLNDAAPKTPAGLAAGAAVASAVSNQLANLGVPVASLPDATPSASATLTNLADIEAGLAACKTPEEKQAFLTKHKDAILKA